MRRKLRLAMLCMMSLPILVYSENTIAEDFSKLAVIQNAPFYNSSDTHVAYIVRVSDVTSWFSMPEKVNVPPGNYKLSVGVRPIVNGFVDKGIGSSSVVNYECTTKAGYVYTVTRNGCSNDGRRMDFEGAKEYWAKVDEDEKQKALIAETARYQSDKLALNNATSKNDILYVISSVEHKMKIGISRDDPEDLLGQAKLLLAPYLKAEADARDRDRVAREKDAAERAKVQVDRQQKELQQAQLFRKTLAEGDDTSCGLVIEKKAKLVKIQLKSSNSEKWVKLDEIYPVGQSCSLASVNTSGTTSNAQGISVGQKICRSIRIAKAWAGVNYNETVKAFGFVENSSDKKIQVRISGMISNGSDITPSGTNINRIDGDIVLENGSVIWDASNNWGPCH